MSRSVLPRLLGVCVLAACVGACGAPVSPPTQPAGPGEEPPPPEAPAEDLKALADGNNRFAIDLYKKLAETDGNVVFSPYSIRTALGMTYAGARGDTAAEMRKVLHLTLADDRLHPAFGAAAHQLQGDKDKPYKLTVANALWGQRGHPFRPEFLDLTRKNYAGGFREVDFAADPEAARQTVNKWVAQQTEDKIPEVLKREEGDVTTATRLVLANAIYMNATWERQFRKEARRDEAFEPAPGVAVKVPMMHHDIPRFRSCSTPDLHMLELPYRGGRLSMLVVLPAKRWGLRDTEKALTAASIHDLIGRLRPDGQNEVALPRFTSRCEFELAGTLSGLGMPLAFSPRPTSRVSSRSASASGK